MPDPKNTNHTVNAKPDLDPIGNPKRGKLLLDIGKAGSNTLPVKPGMLNFGPQVFSTLIQEPTTEPLNPGDLKPKPRNVLGFRISPVFLPSPSALGQDVSHGINCHPIALQ